MKTRYATPADEEFLWTALYYASHSHHEKDVSPDDIRTDPSLKRYVAGWGRDSDLGIVAETDGRVVGAAWVRLLPDSAHSDPCFVDASTPELAIAVLPEFGGQGLGTRMLMELIEVSREKFPAIVLSVRAGNDASRLYRRLGFTEVARIRNRVGTESLKMILSLT